MSSGGDTSWMARGACRGLPTPLRDRLFFPQRMDVGNLAEAKAVCDGCSVLAECRELAITSLDYGTLGGMSEHERRKERQRLKALNGLVSVTLEAV